MTSGVITPNMINAAKHVGHRDFSGKGESFNTSTSDRKILMPFINSIQT